MGEKVKSEVRDTAINIDIFLNKMENIACRICLFKVELTACTNIFIKGSTNELISDMIANFACIELLQDDTLPKVICSACLQKLYSVYQFKKLIITSDLHLRQQQEAYSDHDDQDRLSLHEEESQEAENLNKCTILADEIPFKVESLKNECIDIDMMIPTCGNKVKHTKRAHTCTECSEVFGSKYSLSAHRMIHTGVTPFVCEFCNKGFPMNWALKNHKRKHFATKSYQCNSCDKSFKFPSALTQHQKIHQGILRYKCSTCDKAFCQLILLQAHEQIHVKEKRFICEFCSNRYQTATSLSKHVKIHKNLPQAVCPICSKSYSPRSLKAHLKTHTGEKPHCCDLCNKRFSSSTAVKIHMRIHDDVKPYSCEICGKSFRQICVLRLHKRVHTGETPFSCPVCERKFGYKHHLKKHVEKEHSKN